MSVLKKSAVFLLFAPLMLQLHAAGKYKLSLTLDKASGIYKKGDKVTLNIRCTLDGKPCNGPVRISVRGLDWNVKNQIFKTVPQQFTYNAERAPDAVQFTVTVLDAENKPIQKKKKDIAASVGIAVDPQNFKCALPEPADFRQFWLAAKAELAKIPVKELERKEMKISNAMLKNAPTYFAFRMPQKLPVPKTLEGKFKSFDVKVACAGAPVSGCLTVPAGAAPKSLPAIVSFHGAPGGSARPAFADGVIRFDVNAHGFENGKPREYYKKLHSTTYRGYSFRDSDDRNKFYFRGMFLRVMRALEYVKSLPEYDGKTLIVVGNSQGGAQALAAAGLDEDVKLVYASVPAMCDHGGALVNRRPGWPRLLRVKNGKAVRPQVAQTCPYFDAAHLAKYIKAEAFLTVGLMDTVCSPSSVFCAYNNIPGKKHISILPRHTHSRTYSLKFNQRLMELLKKR